MSMEDTVADLNQTGRSVKSGRSIKSGSNSMSATTRMDEITKQAAKRLGLDENEAKQLYWGGLQKDIIGDDDKKEKVKPKTVADRRVVQEDVQVIEEVVVPAVREVKIVLANPFEPLGILFEGATPKVRSVDPRSPAARAGILPSSIITKIDNTDVFHSLPTLISYLKSIRMAKSREFMLEIYLETPPMAIFDQYTNFKYPALADVKRNDPALLFRHRGRDAAVYTPPEAKSDFTIEALTVNSIKSVDKRKIALRWPCAVKETSSDLGDKVPVTTHHKLFSIPEWVWTVSIEEEAKRADILRLYKGHLLQISVNTPVETLRDIASRELTAISLAEASYYQEPIGWATALAWESDVLPYMRPQQRPHVEPPRVPPIHDWVNPPPRQLRSPRSLPSSDQSGRGVIYTPLDVPRWAVKSVEVAMCFLHGGLGLQPRRVVT
eukprot:TRINITY_DN8968_c0_g2_i1.p1 TRINITY_DN8968_c0_g2~~TRINITY_DN8968_c0_g2_i1.p1  ORF type:complete len:456 (+),score=68.20 TRINITY_DN8968_c0_g2_i1:59-1369(+)